MTSVLSMANTRTSSGRLVQRRAYEDEVYAGSAMWGAAFDEESAAVVCLTGDMGDQQQEAMDEFLFGTFQEPSLSGDEDEDGTTDASTSGKKRSSKAKRAPPAKR